MKYLKCVIYTISGISGFIAGAYGTLTILRIIDSIMYKHKKKKKPSVWKEVKKDECK